MAYGTDEGLLQDDPTFFQVSHQLDTLDLASTTAGGLFPSSSIWERRIYEARQWEDDPYFAELADGRIWIRAPYCEIMAQLDFVFVLVRFQYEYIPGTSRIRAILLLLVHIFFMFHHRSMVLTRDFFCDPDYPYDLQWSPGSVWEEDHVI